jgi:hypothetical protein
MRCPTCALEAPRGELHVHLADAHHELVEAWSDAATGRMRYRVSCPLCGAAHEHRVKPRGRDPSFLATYEREVRLVALDMLLHHLEAEHATEPDPTEGRR